MAGRFGLWGGCAAPHRVARSAWVVQPVSQMGERGILCHAKPQAQSGCNS